MSRYCCILGLIACISATQAVGRTTEKGLALQGAYFRMKEKFRTELHEDVRSFFPKMERLASVYGEELVAAAFENAGPSAEQIVEDAGVYGEVAIRILAKFGTRGTPIASNSQWLEEIDRFGDPIAAVLVQHEQVAIEMVNRFGSPSALALGKVSVINGRKLSAMASEGILDSQLLAVVNDFGDPACEFIWQNRWSLADPSALASFLEEPPAFLSGSRTLPPAERPAPLVSRFAIAGMGFDSSFVAVAVMLLFGIFGIASCGVRVLNWISGRKSASKGEQHVR